MTIETLLDAPAEPPSASELSELQPLESPSEAAFTSRVDEMGELDVPDALEAADPALKEAVRREAMAGLIVAPGQQRSLAPWLFYDRRGSELFEAITELPEYYLTRSERSIFVEQAAKIVNFVPHPLTVVELGAGNAAKTGILLQEAVKWQPELLYQPIDVSEVSLEEAKRSLEGLIPHVTVEPQRANYITSSYTVTRPEGCAILAMYIGSSIGNFSPDMAVKILTRLRKNLRKAGDGLVLGVDLAPCVNKCVNETIAAYNDAQGVTAQFNLNVLRRLNRELGANFDLSRWAHRARWNAEESRIEMHLESLDEQTVLLNGKPLKFAAGETIHTENSYKYTERRVRELLASAGFASPHWLMDEKHRFGVAMSHPG